MHDVLSSPDMQTATFHVIVIYLFVLRMMCLMLKSGMLILVCEFLSKCHNLMSVCLCTSAYMYTSSHIFQTRDPSQEHQNTVGDGGWRVG